MRILVVHNQYRAQGGENIAVEAHIELLRAAGHTVIPLERDSRVINDFGVLDRGRLVVDSVYSRRSARRLRALIRSERPEVAHVHNVFPLISPAAYRVLHEERVPVVQTVHNFRLMCPNGLFYTRGRICERCKGGNTLHAVRYQCHQDSLLSSAAYAASVGLHRRIATFEQINRFIVLTAFTAARLVEAGIAPPSRIETLGNFLSLPLPPPAVPERDDPYLLGIGRLSAEKGMEVPIRALTRTPGLRLILAGSGPARAGLERLAADLGVADRVTFTGYVRGEEKWRLMRGATAVVVPSLCYEQFSLSALEGMAVGTVVLASNLGGLPYLVEDGRSGLLFAPGDDGALAIQIGRLRDDPAAAAALGRGARARVEHAFTGPVHLRRLEAIYESVIREGAG